MVKAGRGKTRSVVIQAFWRPRSWLRVKGNCMEKGFLNLPLVLWYPLLAFILLALVILTMPKQKIKELFFESLAWGLLLSFIFSVAVNRLHPTTPIMARPPS